MTTLQQIGLVAEREFVEYARQRSFRNGTIITALMIMASVAAYSILPAIFGGPDELRLGVFPAAAPVADALPHVADPDAVELEVVGLDDRDAAVTAVREGTVDAVVVGPDEVLVLEELGGPAAELLTNAMTAASLAQELGSSPGEALAAATVAMSVEALDPVDPMVTQRRVLTLVAVLMALGQVVAGSFTVASGVVEEKSTRVVEVIVAKAHPRTLLTGKLVGLAAVLLVQLVVLVVVGLTAVAVSPDLDVPDGVVAVSGAVLLWYCLAFAIFGALLSVAGALSSRQEDMAQKMTPMMYATMAAFGASFYAFANPDTALSRILSFVPFTAPAVLPARQAGDALGVLEGAVAIALALIAAALAIRFAGRVYTAGALRTRGTSTIRRVLRSDEAA